MGLTRQKRFIDSISASAPDEIVEAAQYPVGTATVAQQCAWAIEYLDHLKTGKIGNNGSQKVVYQSPDSVRLINAAQQTLAGLAVLYSNYRADPSDIDPDTLEQALKSSNPLEIIVNTQNILNCGMAGLQKDDILPALARSADTALAYLNGINGNSPYPKDHIAAAQQALGGIKELYREH
ncbi:MAG: hypothetical protein KKE20_07070 [Nanoarchaeota archaeon]|nr:hypothetical protein [Nanoarchaeota archaeon]